MEIQDLIRVISRTPPLQLHALEVVQAHTPTDAEPVPTQSSEEFRALAMEAIGYAQDCKNLAEAISALNPIPLVGIEHPSLLGYGL